MKRFYRAALERYEAEEAAQTGLAEDGGSAETESSRTDEAFDGHGETR